VLSGVNSREPQFHRTAAPLSCGAVQRARLIAGGLTIKSGVVGAVRRLASDFWACRRGVAALEFAMMAPVLIILTFGFIATNMTMYTWSAMQSNAQYAARVIATGQVTSWTSAGSVACSSSPASTTVEYYACQGLPSWASYTVSVSETCSPPSGTPQTVSVTINATAAALGDVSGFFKSKTFSTQTVQMKEGTCP
jgi:Flp pilus assembly protein TadG